MNPAWKTFRLSEVVKIQGGSAFSPDIQGRKEGDFPFYKVSDMNLPENKWRMMRANNYVNSSDRDLISGALKPAGSVIFPKVGAAIHTNKKRQLNCPAFVDNNLMAVWPMEPGVCLPEFLYAYFLTISLSELANAGPLPSINAGRVQELEISLPHIEEQQKITRLLSKIQRALDIEEQQLVESRLLKQATMRDIFTRGLRRETQKESEIGLMPVSWELRTILELCEIWSGGTPRKSNAEYWNGDIPWVSGKDLKLPTLDDAIDHVSAAGAEAGSRIAPQNAVLLLVRGMGLAKDLPVAVINRPMAFNQDVKALVSRGEYSGQFIRSAIYAGKDRLLGQIVPSAHGTMTLNLNDVETFKVACPTNTKEASEIVDILSSIDRKIALHKQKRIVLEELFKSMLLNVMTGEISIAELNMSVAPATSSIGA